MSESGHHEYPDQRRRYILLAMEAEVLSEQAASPYIREASIRLSQFWRACAEASPNDGGMSEEFHAPTRKPALVMNTNVEN
jgi:hypothetical protein